MEARLREARRDPREFDRRAQERAARALAVACVVALGAVGRAPEERAIGRAAILEFRGEDAAGAHRLAVDVARFVEHAEAVAAAQIVIEIDVAGEDLGERERDRRPGRPISSAAPNSDERISPARSVTRVSTGGGALCASNASPLRVIARRSPPPVDEAQREQPAVVVDRDAHRPAGTQLIERPRRRVGAHVRERRRIVDVGAREQAADRVAALHALLAPVDALRSRRDRDRAAAPAHAGPGAWARSRAPCRAQCRTRRRRKGRAPPPRAPGTA